jgi:4-phosphopantoate--beta-alanine ligase
MTIPSSHPRYASLLLREKIAEGVHCGLVHETGLIAHGRGEAFDYLLGEITIPVAERAAKAAAYYMNCAGHPVISVNGNTAVLAGKDIITLAKLTGASIEINLFHRSEKRVEELVSYFTDMGAKGVLGRDVSAHIPGLDHNRGRCSRVGIFSADVVLVPLEDGDRCQALKAMGKTIITIDLNPLSRTSQTADITIVDNVVRAIPNIIECIKQNKHLTSWNNKLGLKAAIEHINYRLRNLYQAQK